MAAVNLVATNHSDKSRNFNYQGSGAIAAGDALVTDVAKYPKGTCYTDVAGRKRYERTAETGTIGDWTVFTGAAAV
jgi:hypothetical protein